MRSESTRVVLLDAMGVLYQSGDDVGELLVPFILERGSKATVRHIEDSYRQASLGAIAAQEFWHSVGLSPEVEDDYLSRHLLSAGVLDFLLWAADRDLLVSCLSNDVAPWSLKLRRRFGLETRMEHWIISGDVKLRKPDRRIYEAAAGMLAVAPANILFVDDRRANVQAAREAGFQAVLFADEAGPSCDEATCVGFAGLRNYLEHSA